MKKIPVGKEKFSIVDDNLFEELSKYKWHLNSWGYASRVHWTSGKDKKRIFLHHVVVGRPPKGMEVDHINRNKLDNRLENLRICTRSENKLNVGIRKNNTSGCKYVHFNKQRGTWQVCRQLMGKAKRFGDYKTLEEAKKVAMSKEVTEFHW